MKTVLFLTFLGIASLLSINPVNAQTEDNADAFALQATLLDYLHGGTHGDSHRLIGAFHNSATLLIEHEGSGEFRELPLESFFADALVKEGKTEKRISRIRTYNITGDAANAKVEHNYGTHKIVEYANLLKINGQWKIVQLVSRKEATSIEF